MPSDKARTRTDAGDEAEGTPLSKTLGRHPLESLMDIRNEQARVYRAVVNGKVQPKTGQGLVYILSQVGRATEVADLEQRIKQLESKS